MLQYPQALIRLIAHFKKLPGVGQKSAERFALHLLDWKEGDLFQMSEAVSTLKAGVITCECCGAWREASGCSLCEDNTRDSSLIAVVATPKEIYTIEQTGQFRGRYYVLGGLLSPMQGRSPDTLRIEPLKEQIIKQSVGEIILALDATIEGDATSLFLQRELSGMSAISRLAFGLPIGSALEYIDEGSLSEAFIGRRPYSLAQ
ncbi:MAG: recombination mediator RecR [Chlamydiota bacterium]|nr:recombination mediator RecR [Chlamydiota bacterium]